MSTHLNSIILLTTQLAVLFTPFAADAQETDRQANWPISIAIQTEGGQKIPAGAYGVVQVDTPRVATLLQLRGVMGRGTATMRSEDNQECLSLPIRFIAGDFRGDSISAHTTKAIRLILQTAGVSKALARGEDIVTALKAGMCRVQQSGDFALPSEHNPRDLILGGHILHQGHQG